MSNAIGVRISAWDLAEKRHEAHIRGEFYDAEDLLRELGVNPSGLHIQWFQSFDPKRPWVDEFTLLMFGQAWMPEVKRGDLVPIISREELRQRTERQP